jgi:photosystem II stability/assembly factor-like uncharacterized protein
MNYRLIQHIGIVLAVVATTGCATDPRPKCDEDPFAYSSLAATPREVTLPTGEQAGVTLDFINLCCTPDYGSYNVGDVELSISESSYYQGINASFSITDLNPDAQTGRSGSTLTLRNDNAPPGRYVITVIATSSIPSFPNFLVKDDSLDITVTVPEPGSSSCAPWTQVSGIPATDFSDVQFPRYSTTGYMTAGITPTSDKLLKSTDAGRTWALLPGTPDDPDGYIERVCFMDGLNGLISVLGAQNNALYRTRNGGTTWEPVTSYTGGSIRSIIYSGNLYVLRRFGDHIWMSLNNGETWIQPVVHPDAVLNDIELVTVNRLVVARGANGTGGLSYSSDEGRTWQPSEAPNKTFLWVDFYDTENGVAGGEGVLALTSDGGVTWRQTGSFNSTKGSAQLYLQPNIGDKRLAYAVGGRDIMETRDSGATWQHVCTTQAPTGLFDIETLYNGATVVISRSMMYRRDP